MHFKATEFYLQSAPVLIDWTVKALTQTTMSVLLSMSKHASCLVCTRFFAVSKLVAFALLLAALSMKFENGRYVIFVILALLS